MTIHHDPEKQQFESCERGHCSHVRYALGDNKQLQILSTWVPEALRSGGRAAQLTRHVLEYAREQGLEVEPICSYTQLFLRRHHAEFADLLHSH